ncbi:hypothetical protein KC350_g92 [Hortaea werneckii]|nr:hypothetical protein KC350_g92 [Hortaea werneckii]
MIPLIRRQDTIATQSVRVGRPSPCVQRSQMVFATARLGRAARYGRIPSLIGGFRSRSVGFRFRFRCLQVVPGAGRSVIRARYVVYEALLVPSPCNPSPSTPSETPPTSSPSSSINPESSNSADPGRRAGADADAATMSRRLASGRSIHAPGISPPDRRAGVIIPPAAFDMARLVLLLLRLGDSPPVQERKRLRYGLRPADSLRNDLRGLGALMLGALGGAEVRGDGDVGALHFAPGPDALAGVEAGAGTGEGPCSIGIVGFGMGRGGG